MSSQETSFTNGHSINMATPVNISAAQYPQYRASMNTNEIQARARAELLGTQSRMFPGDARFEPDPFSNAVDNIHSRLHAGAPNFEPHGGFSLEGNGATINNNDGGAPLDHEVPELTSPAAATGHDRSSSSGSQESLAQGAKFSADGKKTRTIYIEGELSEVTEEQLMVTLKAHEQTGVTIFGRREIVQMSGVSGTTSSAIINLSDIRDADQLVKYLRRERTDWKVEFVLPSMVTHARGGKYISKYEGQVSLTAKLPTSRLVNVEQVKEKLLELLGNRGELHAVLVHRGTGSDTIKMSAEFCDIDAAEFAVNSLNGTIVKDFTIEVAHYAPDVPRFPVTPVRPKVDEEERMVQDMARLSLARPYGTPQIHDSAFAVLSPTSRTFINSTAPVSTPQYAPGNPYSSAQQFGYPPVTPMPSFYTPSTVGMTPFGNMASQYSPGYPWSCPPPQMVNPYQGYGNGQMAPRTYGGYGAQYPGYNPAMTPCQPGVQRRRAGTGRNGDGHGNPSHNVVDTEKIRRGLDVRTTIMLRNIPNKIDQVMLKDIVDETSFGLYDFMYLRIDFANNCNVGYAFLNFEDPIHIIDFVNARAGQRWNKYNSDKIAEVSYATIQGKDCLVQKFRNSSVMLEHPSFRPKIFFTRGHPQAGQEEEFAEPDNPSKMRRSVENAEHVGLFAPRAGQHYRDEQRRRRSRYDRGTHLAELEEQDYALQGGNHMLSMPMQAAYVQNSSNGFAPPMMANSLRYGDAMMGANYGTPAGQYPSYSSELGPGYSHQSGHY